VEGSAGRLQTVVVPVSKTFSNLIIKLVSFGRAMRSGPPCTPLISMQNAALRDSSPIAAVYFNNCVPAGLIIYTENSRKTPVWKNLTNQKSSVP